MVKEYLDRLNDLVNKIYPRKSKEIDIVVKHFFSGAAVYVNGKICMTLTPVGFAIKLPHEDLSKLKKEKGVRSLRYFSKAPIKKEYAVLPKSMMEDLVKLKRLIELSVSYVGDKNERR